MSAELIYAVAGAFLLTLGEAALVLERHLLRRIVALNVVGSGAFLVLVGASQRDGRSDPVPQAMVLTGIVVTVAASALALGLARRLLHRAGRMELPESGDD